MQCLPNFGYVRKHRSQGIVAKIAVISLSTFFLGKVKVLLTGWVFQIWMSQTNKQTDRQTDRQTESPIHTRYYYTSKGYYYYLTAAALWRMKIFPKKYLCPVLHNFFGNDTKFQAIWSSRTKIISKKPKLWLIVKDEHYEITVEIFEGTGVNITTQGRKYLEGVIGSNEFSELYMHNLVT